MSINYQVRSFPSGVVCGYHDDKESAIREAEQMHAEYGKRGPGRHYRVYEITEVFSTLSVRAPERRD